MKDNSDKVNNKDWINPNPNVLHYKWYEHIVALFLLLFQIGLNIITPAGIFVNPWKHEKTDRVWKTLPKGYKH